MKVDTKKPSYDMKTKEEYKAEVLKLMRDLYPTLKGEEKERAERLFPELKKSDDERIRKGLVAHLKDLREWEVGKSVPIKTSEHYDAWLALLERQCKQKQEWSDEDLISLGYLATFVDENGDSFYGKNKPNVVKWIRSFANLNPTQKQGLSEEDRRMITAIIADLSFLEQKTKAPGSFDREKNWLKSLKDRYTWKPSDEQMMALRRMKAAIAGEGEIYKPLNSLYEDLMKLNEK